MSVSVCVLVLQKSMLLLNYFYLRINYAVKNKFILKDVKYIIYNYI